MTSPSLSPLRRLHHFHFQRKNWSLQSRGTVVKLLSVEKVGHSRRIDQYRCLTAQLSRSTTRNISSLSGGNHRNSRSSEELLILEPILTRNCCKFFGPAWPSIYCHSKNNRNKHQDYTHTGISFAIRHFSSLSTNSTDDDRKTADIKDKIVRLEENDKAGKIEHDNHENDRYYYLIKQKYSPSRHQKYRPNSGDGLLEKTISNKPLKDRIVQSYADVVAYFMPKGENNFMQLFIVYFI